MNNGNLWIERKNNELTNGIYKLDIIIIVKFQIVNVKTGNEWMIPWVTIYLL